MAPSITAATSPRLNWRVSGSGYTSSTEGMKTKSTPAPSSLRQSASSVRGYVARSSALLNCVGFTNTLTTTTSFSLRARSTRDICPSCKAPIVGTRPTIFPESLASAINWRRCPTFLIIFICKISSKPYFSAAKV